MGSSVKRMTCAVSVATVWTAPEASRPVDEPALQNPAAIGDWLRGMTVEERLDLCESNRVQTQILYGTSVLVEEERGAWAKVLIPEQWTRKQAAGYPGWVPLSQLVAEGAWAAASGCVSQAAGAPSNAPNAAASDPAAQAGGAPGSPLSAAASDRAPQAADAPGGPLNAAASDHAAQAAVAPGGPPNPAASGPAPQAADAPGSPLASPQPAALAAPANGGLRAVVSAAKARLFRGEAGASPGLAPRMELSFLTSLPVLGQSGEWVRVWTPHGEAFLHADDVRVAGDGAAAAKPADGHTGRSIVEQAKRFIGLPYLWGGMSAYGFDCSGFACQMHRCFGIALPRDASDQARHGRPVERETLAPGDLLFFSREGGRGAVHHVGIYAGDGRMVHSPETRGAVELVELAAHRLANEHSASRRYWAD